MKPAVRTLAFLAVALLIWATGLAAFTARVARSTPAPEPTHAEGIVALTGASDQRIEAATGLLQQGLGDRMLVSGVNPHVRRPELAPVTGARTGFYDCCIDLGFAAANTLGNARETTEWARSKAYRRLILVTADYHMPRAMLELNAVLRGTGIMAETYAVATPALKARGWWRSPGAARLMVLEYCKYLAILGREGVLGLGPRAAPVTQQKAQP